MIAFVYAVPHDAWISDPTRSCGPIETETNFEKPITDTLNSHSVSAWIYEYSSQFIPGILGLLFLSLGIISFNRNRRRLFERFVDESIRDYESQQSTLNRLIAKKQQKVDLMQEQADERRRKEEMGGSEAYTDDDD